MTSSEPLPALALERALNTSAVDVAALRSARRAPPMSLESYLEFLKGFPAATSAALRRRPFSYGEPFRLQVRAGAAALAVSLLGFWIEVSPADLSAWCDQAQSVASTEMLEASAADGLASRQVTPVAVSVTVPATVSATVSESVTATVAVMGSPWASGIGLLSSQSRDDNTGRLSMPGGSMPPSL